MLNYGFDLIIVCAPLTCLLQVFSYGVLVFQVREEEILFKLKNVVKEQADILNKFRLLNPVDDKVSML
jgi:hypothetical protein